MTCFAPLWTTKALKDNFSLKKKVRSPDLQTAQTNLISESFEYNMSTSSTNWKLFEMFENYCRLGWATRHGSPCQRNLVTTQMAANKQKVICKLIITSSRKWFRANELPLMSPCTSPLLFRNAKPLSMSPTKTKHVSSAIIGHASTGNSFLRRSICCSSVPPEKEISFNFTNDDDNNSHGKGLCTDWNWTFWDVGYIVILLALLCRCRNVLSCSSRVLIK